MYVLRQKLEIFQFDNGIACSIKASKNNLAITLEIQKLNILYLCGLYSICRCELSSFLVMLFLLYYIILVTLT